MQKGSEFNVYYWDPLIYQQIEALGLTQEDLADGICSVTTLSRIENGERLPDKQHSEMLLQRLGYSDPVHISSCFIKSATDHNRIVGLKAYCEAFQIQYL